MSIDISAELEIERSRVEVAAPLLALMVRRNVAGDLRRLKTILEARHE